MKSSGLARDVKSLNRGLMRTDGLYNRPSASRWRYLLHTGHDNASRLRHGFRPLDLEDKPFTGYLGRSGGRLW